MPKIPGALLPRDLEDRLSAEDVDILRGRIIRSFLTDPQAREMIEKATVREVAKLENELNT